MKLLFEVRRPSETSWHTLSILGEADAPASVSSYDPVGNGRQVFVFGWVEGDGPGLWRLIGSSDVEMSNDRSHSVHEPMERVTTEDLREKPHEMEIFNRRAGRLHVRVRTEE